MAKYYYNGVLLPKIPADVLAQHPYCWIRENKTTGYYDLNFANGVWYLRSDGALTPSISTNYPYYRIPIETAMDYEEWEFYQTTSYAFALDENKLVLWASHDIPNGSTDATDIYFYGSDPVPEETDEPEEPEVVQYLIREDSLIAIGDGFRSSRGTTKKYTLEEMAVLAAEKTSGGGSMFASNASGRIPEYEKGTANSEFTLNFESSAVGALSE